jgi:hypothetical protein
MLGATRLRGAAADSRDVKTPGSAGSSSSRPFAGSLAAYPIPDRPADPELYKDFRPESRQDDPPNLSILISGGKENNRDALSNGE